MAALESPLTRLILDARVQIFGAHDTDPPSVRTALALLERYAEVPRRPAGDAYINAQAMASLILRARYQLDHGVRVDELGDQADVLRDLLDALAVITPHLREALEAGS